MVSSVFLSVAEVIQFEKSNYQSWVPSTRGSLQRKEEDQVQIQSRTNTTAKSICTFGACWCKAFVGPRREIRVRGRPHFFRTWIFWPCYLDGYKRTWKSALIFILFSCVVDGYKICPAFKKSKVAHNHTPICGAFFAPQSQPQPQPQLQEDRKINRKLALRFLHFFFVADGVVMIFDFPHLDRNRNW